MIIQEPFLTSSIGGDTIKTNFSGSAYLGYGATSSHATASNEFVIGFNITGSGNDSIRLLDQFKSTISGSYIGHGAVSSSISASNEIVIGLGTIGKGNDTVNIADSFVSYPSRSYVGYGSSESTGSANNELVFGINITGSGDNTITLGNENTIETHLFGSIYRTQFVTSSITASKFKAYALSGSSYTLHLPPSPNPGDSIKISNFQTNATGSNRYSSQISGSERITIGRSGEAIMGITESMELDYQSPTFEMMYIDSTRGWVIFGGN